MLFIKGHIQDSYAWVWSINWRQCRDKIKKLTLAPSCLLQCRANIYRWCSPWLTQNTQFVVTVLFCSSLTVIHLHSTVYSRRRAEKFAAAGRWSAFVADVGVNFSAARRGSLVWHTAPTWRAWIKEKQKTKYVQYYTWGVKYLSVRIFKKLSSNKIGVN